MSTNERSQWGLQVTEKIKKSWKAQEPSLSMAGPMYTWKHTWERTLQLRLCKPVLLAERSLLQLPSSQKCCINGELHVLHPKCLHEKLGAASLSIKDCGRRRKACPEQRWTFKANLSTHSILHLMIGRNALQGSWSKVPSMYLSFLQKKVQGLLSEFIIYNIFRASQNVEAWITIAPPSPCLSSLTLHRCSAWTITIAPRAGHPPVPGKTLGRVWKKMEKVCPSCPEEHKANLRDSVMEICAIRGTKH